MADETAAPLMPVQQDAPAVDVQPENPEAVRDTDPGTGPADGAEATAAAAELAAAAEAAADAAAAAAQPPAAPRRVAPPR